MNKKQYDILLELFVNERCSQRYLAEKFGYSLGSINKEINKLGEKGYVYSENVLTDKSRELILNSKTDKAIILAAGYGMRMVPLNTEMTKGLITIKNETMIERLIKQLHEVGVNDISVVVGFMKEQYEFLIDLYGVKLVVNTEYKHKNNLHSLSILRKELANTYVVPCDIYCKENPFNKYELYSWYMVSDMSCEDSEVRINRNMELVRTNKLGNKMIGISYISEKDAEIIEDKLQKFDNDRRYDNSFWEEALYEKDKMIVYPRLVDSSKYVEINTYEQLREVDSDSNNLKSDILDIIAKTLDTDMSNIKDIRVLKKGMTNRSFIFTCNNLKYIARVPGEGTDQLINRRQEAQVYETINGLGVCDNVVYINPDNGYKVTEYLCDSRVCDSDNVDDIKKCMKKLREFHDMKLCVDHEFDIYGQLEFYESLWNGKKSIYRDYECTKNNIYKLKKYIECNVENKVLTHIDAVCDNFLFHKDNDGNEQLRLIDWEYAGMQDPHVDIAMFCIYALYDRNQVDRLIDIYFDNQCENNIRIKIYAYIALCGLLWSNWCEYKLQLGVEFGEYSLKQYRYAKEYYRVVEKELEKIGEQL